MATGSPVQLGVRVIHVLVVAQFNTAKGVDHFDKAAELHHGNMVDFLPCDVFNLVDQLFSAIQLRDRIDFHIVLVDFHQGITRNGNQ